MITELKERTLPAIKNPVFARYAGMYAEIYRGFMAQVAETGIQIDPTDYAPARATRIERLLSLGANIRNDDKSLYTTRISPACEACQTGVGSATFFVSLKCHRNCYYCFNPNQAEYDYYTTHTRDLVQELEQVHRQRYRVKHLALTGGEPLLFKDEALAFFETAEARFPDAYTRLYTCGDYADEATLQALGASGLEEIRFSIRMHDLEKGHRQVFDHIRAATRHIPYVMVEMPVLPGTYQIMQGVLDELEAAGIFGINLLEFCYPFANTEAFKTRGFQIKNPPYRVLYDYWYAGGLPVAGSELVCLDLLEYALQRELQLGVHYCSLENKHTGQVYQQNSVQSPPRTAYFSERDYFFKTAKVFGEDIAPVERKFRRANYDRYAVQAEHNYLEFHPLRIPALRGLEVEVGLSTSIYETREGETYLRELKIDYTTPEQFDVEQDL